MRTDDRGDNYLVAYVVGDEKRQPKASELRAFLKLRLPPFMLPASFAFRETMPVTANGKIDRAALRGSGE